MLRPDGGTYPLDVNQVDYNDPRVMEMIGRGRCEGVFQLESSGMKSFMKELKPHTLEDIIAGIALYRPGPMDFIPRYIRGKEHPESVTYDTPLMEPILKNTYGCIVYQEQVMQIVRGLGGYSMGRADLVRRAMSKKKASVMEKERKNFIYGNPEEQVPGCIAEGIPEEVASHIFDEMTDFAKYAFNKSHAAAYAVVSFQTAYLKYYYPAEYMAALLTSVIDNPSKCAEYLMHCRALNIGILPPSVNEGEGRFTTETKEGEDGSHLCIRCGMYAIKSVGRGVIDLLVAKREREGPYLSFRDFLERTYGRDMNKRAIENLIHAGACDCFEGTRKQLMAVYPGMLEQVALEAKESITGQMSLFDFMKPEEKKRYENALPDIGDFTKETRLAFEKEVLGIYLSGHPMDEYEDLWRSRITAVSTDFALDEETGSTRVQQDARVVIGGMITSKSVKYTKQGKTMAFITVEDLLGSVEVIVFPGSYEKYRDLLEEDEKVFIEGRVSVEDDKASKLFAEKISRFSDVPRELWVACADMDEYLRVQGELQDLAGQSEGIDELYVFLRDSRQYRRIVSGSGIFISPERALEICDNKTALFVVDTARRNRVECEELLEKTRTLVVLDHHRQTTEQIQNAALSYIEPSASSASEMVAEVLQYFEENVRLKYLEADCMYAGIIIDTNNFVAKTGARTFEAAAYLRRSGADVVRVRKMLREDMDSYKARAEAVRHAENYMGCYAISILPSEGLATPNVVGAQAANELLNIVGVRASFVVTEYGGRVFISARAIDEVNVQVIMERLGGGGHMNIAGAQLTGITCEEAVEKVKETLLAMTQAEEI